MLQHGRARLARDCAVLARPAGRMPHRAEPRSSPRPRLPLRLSAPAPAAARAWRPRRPLRSPSGRICAPAHARRHTQIAMEYCGGGSLCDIMAMTDKLLTEEQARSPLPPLSAVLRRCALKRVPAGLCAPLAVAEVLSTRRSPRSCAKRC